MPRIKQYDSSTKILTDDKGTNAWETAGRRIGPLYNLAAGDIKDLGRYAAKGVSDLEDMGAPKKKTVAETSTSSAGKGTASDGTSTSKADEGTASWKDIGIGGSGGVRLKGSSKPAQEKPAVSGSTVTGLTTTAKDVVAKKGEATEEGPDYTKWNQAQLDLFNSGGPNAEAAKAADAAAPRQENKGSDTRSLDESFSGEATNAPTPKPKPASSSVWDLVSGIASSAYNGITTNTNPTSTSVDTSNSYTGE